MSILLKTVIVLAVAGAGVCAAPSSSSAQNYGARRVQQDIASVPTRNGDKSANWDDWDAAIQEISETDYNCELGNKITLYQNEREDSHIAIRWNQGIHRLYKVVTTTGVRRFENQAFGLTWIALPAKGILLDSKLNRQLANECMSAQQEKDSVARDHRATRSD